MVFRAVLALAILVPIFMASRAEADLSSADKAVVQEINTFIQDYVEELADDFIPVLSEKDKGACSGPGGKYFRTHCCVIYSNLAFVMLENKYGNKPGSKFWHLFHKNRQKSALAVQMRLSPVFGEFNRVATVKDDGDTGVYSTTVKIQEIEYKVLKCDIGSLHTYLLLLRKGESVTSREAIILDMSIKQFYVLPELLTEDDYEELHRLGVEKTTKPWFVGTRKQFLRVVNATRTKRNILRVVPSKDKRWERFSRILPVLPNLVDVSLQEQFCGKPYHIESDEKEL
mmetsp:Transcript_5672/g.6557  ORF Transcript_5672/g.6557 Transcript_5672/m.6557 type:complete len:285 (+) Transcript_5672:123-977(+)|eukprot:CAMPEP_0184055022 /NCGR_PEP_ID=MMETSP0956-20121227/6928_1 /TAXON_ID=627963 /ORGANISM="Aplanochytrium sp, Strain PBS07" /LENGTH=284 /DNA_ID=CAMNT_0026348765 /DNA_START=782 /DNA_END=1636 /DNA_ORIENTATION=-